MPRSSPRFTALQGPYLAFIHSYTRVNRRPPAEADIQGYFGVTPPTVHPMLVRLDEGGGVSRTPGRARSIRVLLSEDEIPRLA